MLLWLTARFGSRTKKKRNSIWRPEGGVFPGTFNLDIISPTRITLLRSRRRVFFAACLAVLLPIGAHACPVCFLLPTKTPADFLIESDFVVLARESPQQPFTYSPVQVLKGDSAPEEFGLFVDSTTRRRLKTNLNDAVVLVRMGRGKAWRSLGIADAKYQDVVQRILLFADTWTREGGSQERYKFFLSLFGNGNRTIFELSYLELGRAPYSTIKKVARAVSPDDLRPILTRRIHRMAVTCDPDVGSDTRRAGSRIHRKLISRLPEILTDHEPRRVDHGVRRA
jgi:hypothetical protein